MIDSTAIERAEKTLTVVYGGDLGRQLQALQVDRASMDNVIAHCWGVLDSRYGEAKRGMDPRIQAGLNTLFTHMFLLGLIAGRNSIREIA